MPSFYPQAMPGNLPLTPPDFYPGYECHTGRQAQHPQESYMTAQGMPPRLDSVVDYSQHYAPPSGYPAPSQGYQRNSGYQSAQGLPSIGSYYEPIGAPILPPLRIQDNYADEGYRYQMQQSQCNQAMQQQQAAKEEKPTGGVSAKLDYEMDRMTDFVCNAAQSIIQPVVHTAPSFRKWVHQVLSATRLPSATILLSLHYLTVRMRNFPRTVEKSENQIYRLLAVSMILGSKFLDDNTFINRSWSDVSGIKVTELNNLEIEWLALIGFDLHVDPSDPEGVTVWLRQWKEYDVLATNKARVARLSPLNTNVPRQSLPLRSSHTPYQQGYSKPGHGLYTPLSTNTSSAYGNSSYMSADPWNRTDASHGDIWSRPETSTMAAYYSLQSRYPTFDEADHASRLAPLSHDQRNSASYGRNVLPRPQSFAPNLYNPWNQTWGSGHGHGCNCHGCARLYGPSMGGAGYAPQTVVG